jgi:hypothetical protein
LNILGQDELRKRLREALKHFSSQYQAYFKPLSAFLFYQQEIIPKIIGNLYGKQEHVTSLKAA